MRQLFVIFIVLWSISPEADATTGQLDAYLDEARSLGLSERSQWLALLHYRRQALGVAIESQVDDADFFLAEHGHIDAAAELEADLRAFLQPSAAGHAQCYFPARWHWLKQQLSIDDSHDVPCPKFERWSASVSNDSLTMIFPAMYLNNPGSSFGHTFIRFDDQDSTLLSHALNFAAAYDPEDGFLNYAWKGMSGGYDGIFKIQRYFEMVQEYTNLENRDIWEYRMDYTSEEIEQLIRHVWEVHGVRFKYYFLTENCSYRLLALLDVLREGSSLAAREHFPWYAIPVDTVRVVDEAGVITERHYRPSLMSQISRTARMMSDESVATSLAIVDGTLEADEVEAAENERVAIYEAAYDILQFRGQADEDQAQETLLARSRLDQSSIPPSYDLPAPEFGHASARLDVGVGERDDQAVRQIGIRPSFHDLLDDPAGYVYGTEIVMLSLKLSQLEDDDLRLEELVFVDIQSLPAMTAWYQPLSWVADIRLQRHQAYAFATAEDFNAIQFTAGVGVTLEAGEDGRLYALAIADINVADELDEGFAARPGLRFGWLWYPAFGQWQVSYQSLYQAAGHETDARRLALDYQFQFTTDVALRVGLNREEYDANEIEAWSASVLWYF